MMFQRTLWIALLATAQYAYGQTDEVPYDYNDPYYSQEWNSCGSVIRVDAEFLWLRTCPDGLYIAAKQEKPEELKSEGGAATVFFRRSLHAESFDEHFSPGIRLGIAYQPAQSCCWDGALKWTYFSPSYDRTIRKKKIEQEVPDGDGTKIILVDAGESLFPFRSLSVSDNLTEVLGRTTPVSAISNIETVKGEWDLDLSLLDLELGRRFWVGSCFSVRPNIALRLAQLDQNMRVTTKGNLFGAGELPLTADFTIVEHFKNEFTGIGPRFGFELEWDIGCGAGVYGSGAISLLFGDRDAYSRQGAARTNTKIGTTAADIQNTKVIMNDNPLSLTTNDNNKKHCTRPMTDLDFGVYWSTCVGHGRYNVMLKLGWEHRYYFNQGVGDAAAGYTLLCKEEDGAISSQGLRFGGSVYF